ncbi:HNH endonuclease [Cytobacillus firmus]|nr:HNH endonuclease [Cytobacillus firmus]
MRSFLSSACFFLWGKCFYCGKTIKKKEQAHVDHFIPGALFKRINYGI